MEQIAIQGVNSLIKNAFHSLTHTLIEELLVQLRLSMSTSSTRTTDLLNPSHSRMLTFFCLLFVFQGIQQKRPSAAQNAILRRYFLELTQSFIIPLVKSICLFLF